MGRFSVRPPRSQQHWFSVGSIDVTTTTLVTGLCVLSLLVFAVNSPWLNPLALDSNLIVHGQVWRLLTWPLVNSPVQGFFVVFGIAVFWWVGQSLESIIGRNRFLRFIVLLTIIPALGITLFAAATGQIFEQPSSGIYGLETAVIAAYAATYPGSQSFFGIKFWVLALVLLGISALQYLALRDWASMLLMALECAIGLLAARSFGMSRVEWIPNIPLPAFITANSERKEARTRQRESHLKVVRDTDINSLLDKIAEKGMQSLTSDERRRLDDYSRKRDN